MESDTPLGTFTTLHDTADRVHAIALFGLCHMAFASERLKLKEYRRWVFASRRSPFTSPCQL